MTETTQLYWDYIGIIHTLIFSVRQVRKRRKRRLQVAPCLAGSFHPNWIFFYSLFQYYLPFRRLHVGMAKTDKLIFIIVRIRIATVSAACSQQSQQSSNQASINHIVTRPKPKYFLSLKTHSLIRVEKWRIVGQIGVFYVHFWRQAGNLAWR